MEWKVTKERIEIAPHYNADALEVAKVGDYQLVVRKGEFNTGDEVIFIPEKSVLPDHIADKYRDYLAGPEKNRVKSVRLRGEYSCGVVLPLKEATECLWPIVGGDAPSEQADQIVYWSEYGEDLSHWFDITKYEPPIPTSLAGQVKRIEGASYFTSHDCIHLASMLDDFEEGEDVFVTEKVHGSQAIYYLTADGEEIVTSKGISKRGLKLEESDTNAYWRAARSMEIFENLAEHFPNQDVQLFGEVVPVQGGYDYGFTEPHVLFFKIVVDGVEIEHHELTDWFYHNWVPIIYFGPLEKDTVRNYAKGMEAVSRKQRHIREGVVVTPSFPRRDSRGRPLFAKIINPKYKETGEELN